MKINIHPFVTFTDSSKLTKIKQCRQFLLFKLFTSAPTSVSQLITRSPNRVPKTHLCCKMIKAAIRRALNAINDGALLIEFGNLLTKWVQIYERKHSKPIVLWLPAQYFPLFSCIRVYFTTSYVITFWLELKQKLSKM